ncbi:uracil-DNA glycosylase [bacterium (Candidatus Blackallbacteria) CG17_big_fil_post_rev_8_21_14_2_50_48_46]|uniref:Type-4 uracil-DNA glycosylase n=1 Tax=bacterium (Candidatus Blackallbacteria) CG17_big_fil_post_rev_8_21_14_2_50_48_46 TaxID=2014261 RepID=A0A2M7FYJ2_9BACT|nr:MAG: uracil-DNA glycosylase [bacterium (Candidatus Blackallbacteria) CG18_big_fil_WC_8_21_14_2_50_49_26]PIW14413.1 MAG: uracil-DNA glycosylase [bacterium (Candidatus Blackallbacteria) CG17_big_fil_post_rev_8_21_14_2_50_48_46]PIW46920.1 MAG: uracil-DNA glycosylase [bacterium (Candidatus Blackallbacteria) CG13_big_fil_rev_8_21_14_2_50_49_14]
MSHQNSFSNQNPDSDRAHFSAPKQSEKEQALQVLAQACSQCQKCGLYKGRTFSVFSDGNPAAHLMVIGEGPGQHEDETGVPFVGKAGQLLTKMLASVGFDRQQDTYIANVVKCRPPQNRTPTQQEMQTCLPFLEQQIQLVQPQIIILTGATALKGLFGENQSISRARGKWIFWNAIWCMPTFHPAYLLRNDSRQKGSPKWLAWQDLKEIKRKYLELNPSLPPEN